MLLIIYIPVTRARARARERESSRRSRVGGGNAIDGEQEGDLWYPRSRVLETLRVLSLSLSLSLPGPCRRLKRLADLLPKRGGKMST